MEDKKMKKYLYNIFMLAAVAVAFVSCEKENTPVEGTFTLTVDATKEGTKGTKQLGLDGSTLNATWAAGEQVKVYNGETLLGTLTPQTTGSAHTKLSGTLEGTIAVDDMLTLKFLSPDYGSQDGTLAYIAANCDYAVATVTVSGFSGDATKTIKTTGHANFVNQQAIVKFTLKDTSNADISATQLVVNDGATDYTINPASAASEIYVAIPGFRWQTVRLTATVGSVGYTYKKSDATFTNGQYYGITVKMTGPYPLLSTATTADYGKVVCAAGHLHDAKTAVPAGCTAVGILGKVTSTGHGLILALKNALSQTWNTIDGWATVKTYAGTTLKVLPDDSSVRGVELKSYTALGATAVSNWAVAQKSDYEAIFTNLGSTVINDGQTYDANVNDYITGVGGSPLSSYYWSATWKNDNRSWYFYRDYWSYTVNEQRYFVRPVLGF